MVARTALCLLVCTLHWAHGDVELITKPRPGEEYVILSSGQQTSLKAVPGKFESKIPLKHRQKPVLTTVAPDTNKKSFDYIPINFDTIDDINSGLQASNVNLETAGTEQKQHSRIQIKKGPNGQDYEYEYIYYYYDEDEEGKKDGKGKEKSTSTTEEAVYNSHDGPLKTDTDNHIANESKTKNKYSTIDRSGTATTATPEQNEIVPVQTRGRGRGRNIPPPPVEEEVEEETRLPSSTRFPPRGRNLASASTTTYAPEVSSEPVRQRGRQSDSVADESIGQTRSRTRAHIRRPSSELVDLDSFKTNSGDIPSQYKEPPSRYSSEVKTTTEEAQEEEEETTENEPEYEKESARQGHSLDSGIKFQEIVDDSKLPADYKQTTTYEQDTTEYTTMTAMEKVALDLYAYLAGENLNNEINPTSNDLISFDGTTTVDDDSWTTEPLSTTEELTTPTITTTTTTTSTTTTTTTTPAPTTTTTTTAASSTRPSRFKGRPGARARVSSTSTATEAPQETSTRARGRFNKPNGVRKTTAPAAAASPASESATVSSAAADKPTTKGFGRRGLFAGRTRPSSTPAAPAQEDGSSAASETPAPRPRLRPGLRRAPSSTTTAASSAAAPAEETTAPSAGASSGEVAETTAIPSRTLGRGRPGLRPASLRPGPRLNLRPSPRLRPGAASVAPSETASEGPAETSAPDSAATEAETENSSPTPAPEQPRGGIKLRNRLQVSPSPKPRATAAPPARRPNPLLKRKLASPATEATTEAPKKSTETTEESTSDEKSETETESAVAETTPAPPLRGLNALIARRRAAGGIGGRPARPARGAFYHPK